MKTASRYERRGVSARKEGVHRATRNLDKGLFPGAFCTILPDHFTGSRRHCVVSHADGAGTKPILSYLYLQEHGDLTHFGGNAQDSLVMNTDDVACVGAVDGPFLITQTIDRNRATIPDEVVEQIIAGCKSTCDMLTHNGTPCIYAGGETADVGDSVRTVTINNSLTVRLPRKKVIDASAMKPGDHIVGFSSTGQAFWEPEENSSIGSNGLTNARHDVLAPRYRRYNEAFCPSTPTDLIYAGAYKLRDNLPGDGMFSIAGALLSPTRTYVPLLKKLIPAIGVRHIHGIIHCSGGGQTKIGKFGQAGNIYVKDNLFPVPPLFAFLKKTRRMPWKQMYESYNMGHRMEVVVESRSAADECIEIARQVGIDAQIVGRVRRGKSPGRSVLIKTDKVEHSYAFAT